MAARIGPGLEVEDTALCIRQDLRERFGGDIEAGLPGDRVEREPAEPVAMHDDEIGPVDTPGLVQEDDLRNRDLAELFGKEAPDEGHIRCQSGSEVVGLLEPNLPAPGAACACAPDEGDVAAIAPVENLFYRRFTHFSGSTLLWSALSVAPYRAPPVRTWAMATHIPATTAVAGMVRTHAMTISRTTPHLTAE